MPDKAVTLNILDVAGNLQLTQRMIDEFVSQHPDVVAKVTYSKATAPELAGKVKAQQDAGRVDIDLVLTGTDGLAAGVEQGLWMDLLPQVRRRAAGMKDYLAPAREDAGAGRRTRASSSPTTRPARCIEYTPAKVPTRRRRAEELLAYAKAQPGQGSCTPGRRNSGPGRTFLMGLPYILGDKDPKDPINGWDKTWAYLKELDQYVDYYPSGTTDTMKDLANGIARHHRHTTGWDINPRVLGTVPKEFKTRRWRGSPGSPTRTTPSYPRASRPTSRPCCLRCMNFMLTPEQQAKAYDKGYFYPGPAIKDVTLQHGAAGEPGRDRGVRPAGVRRS